MLVEFVGLLVLAAFFSSAETAITAIDNYECNALKKSRKKNDKRVSFLIKEKEKIVSTTLVATNFFNMLLSSVVTVFTIEIIGIWYLPVTTAVTTVVIIVFAEIIPKTLSTYYALAIVRKTSILLYLVYIICYPFVFIFSLLSNFVIWALHLLYGKEKKQLTEEELKELINIGKEDGALLGNEHNLLKKAIHLKNMKIKSLMTKTPKIVFVKESSSFEDVINAFRESNFSRLPVLSNDEKTFLGLIHYKDVLFNFNEEWNLSKVMKTALFIPESSSVFSIIKLMNQEKRNMVFVIDESGDVLGLLTMDDIIALICGKSKDEYRQGSEEAKSSSIKHLQNGTIEVDPSLPLGEINELLGTNFSSLYYESLTGLILEKCQYLPKMGDTIEFENVEVKIASVKGSKIGSVIIEKKR